MNNKDLEMSDRDKVNWCLEYIGAYYDKYLKDHTYTKREFIKEWLDMPDQALRGKCPSEMFETGKINDVFYYLWEINEG